MMANRTPRLSRREARGLQALSIALLLAFSAAAVTGCETSHAATARPAMGPMPVSVVRVKQADVPLTGQWVGTLDGYVNAQIQPQVSGYLVNQEYREGSQVAKGQVLFRIDPRPFQAVVDQAEAQVQQAKGQLAQAQAQLVLAQINVKRDTPLAHARAIAQSQLDNDTQQEAQARAAVATGEGAVSAAQAELMTARLNLGFTQVRSLIGGVAGQATTQVGNLVNPESVLTAVSQLNPIKVYFSISDSEYLALADRARQSGSDLLHEGSNLSLSLTLANGQTFPYRGHIIFVDRQMNQQTGAIRIAAAFPNPGNILRPGEFGRVTAETEILHNALLVPQIAVQDLQGIEQVYTVGPGNRVHVVNVKLGAQHGQDWIVDSGLEPGAQVITDNLQKLREGAPVAPHTTQPAPAANVAAGS
ncbi:MAG TPA: efflux RND transporter periplasmic adaptor subunit [Acidobacteriaceae bacterium]|nr:efflux RND transporter periplasmic adaptor subunit [Acidobacteriaceae bacterium]